MHISVQHTTRDPSIDKECCVDAIEEAAHKLFQGKRFCCEFVRFSPHLCVSFLLLVSSFCKDIQ